MHPAIDPFSAPALSLPLVRLRLDLDAVGLIDYCRLLIILDLGLDIPLGPFDRASGVGSLRKGSIERILRDFIFV